MSAPGPLLVGVTPPPVPSAARALVGERALFWKVFGVLTALAVIGSAAVVPYSLALMRQMEIRLPPNVPPTVFWAVVMGLNACFEVVLSAGAILLGLWLGRGIGLGAPLIEHWLAGNPTAPRRMARSLLPAAIAGVLLAVWLLLLLHLLPSMVPPMTRHPIEPRPGAALLASLGAGIREELWLRLGLLTLFAWIGTRLARRPRPGVMTLWIANVMAAVFFGMIHLPQVASLVGPLTPWLVAYVLVLNGVCGLVFGWIYWRNGLIAAMFCHFAADLVAKVVWPLVHGS